MQRRLRRFVALVAVIGVITLGLYAVVAVAVYDEVSRTEDRMPDGRPRYADVDPSRLTFTADGLDYDFASYAMPTFRDVRFGSRDPRIEVAGWFVQAAHGSDAPAVILAHGLGASRRDPAVLVPAGMLHASGFTVLVIDLRDHGDSTWEDGRYAGGAEEQADLLGARDWLVANGVEPERIGLFGTSMGAGAALIATAVEPGIPAVWADSSYADTEQRIAEELRARGYPTVLAPAAPLVARLMSGDDLTAWTPLTAVRALGGRALYVAHGGDDPVTGVHHAHDLIRAAASSGVTVGYWIGDGMGHTEAYRRDPEEYETRLVEFFRRHLPGRSAARPGPSVPLAPLP